MRQSGCCWQVASQTRYLWSQGCEAYFLYVEHPGRPSNEVWRRELTQHSWARRFAVGVTLVYDDGLMASLIVQNFFVNDTATTEKIKNVARRVVESAAPGARL